MVRIANNNKSTTTIVKRLVLELENGQNVYLTNKCQLFDEIRKFYMPKHLNLNFMNILVNLAAPNRHPYEVDALKSLNLCAIVVNESNLNGDGQILFSGNADSEEDDCNVPTFHSLAHLNKQAKLIAVVKQGSDRTVADHKVLGMKPDLIISNSYVLKLNKFTDKFQLVEVHGNSCLLDESEVQFSLKRIQLKPAIDKINIKQMLQQCI